jgi:hypothetical protein
MALYSRPLYDDKELDFLLKAWANGSLDQYTDPAKPLVGIRNCVVTSHGLKAQSLVERITLEDVDEAIEVLMADEARKPSMVMLLLVFLGGLTIERLGQVFGYQESKEALSHFIKAKDDLVEVLLRG